MDALLQAIVRTVPQTMGACLVGSYLSAVFYGLTLLQTYQYFTRYYGQDSPHLYALVVVLTLLDTFAVVTNMDAMWFYLIKNYGNPAAILITDWSLTLSVITTAIVAFLVQSFYAYRTYILGGRKILLPLAIVLVGFASLVLAVVYMALITKNGSLLFIPTVNFLSTASLACGLGADLLIATSITVYLLQGRQRSFRRSDTLVRKLVIYTINTGIVTTICTLLTLVLGEALPNTYYNTVFYFPLSKCYVNSFLAFLNARESLRGGSSTAVNSYHLSNSALRPGFKSEETDVEETLTGRTLVASQARGSSHEAQRKAERLPEINDAASSLVAYA